MSEERLASAYRLLEDSILHYRGKPVGTRAAMDPKAPAAENYEECFVRDFVPSALVFLHNGRTEIVRNFLEVVESLRTRERSRAGHEIQPGVMPASFRIDTDENGEEHLLADFGERAIGRVAPVDSMMWWMVLLYIYTRHTGDRELAQRPDVQSSMRQILHLCLKDTFEVSPGLLVPDGCSMIDRRLGIYGHPLEIQALFYGVLRSVHELIEPRGPEDEALLESATTREQALRNYVRLFYWLDLRRLNEIHRYSTEEFGSESVNMLNIYPESIPDWVVDWLPEEAGYLVGNTGPSRMDFRFFSLGNLLAILFGLATDEQAERTVRLFEARWEDLVGAVPLKICFPAMEGLEWQVQTGSDPKNVAWSYQNGGNWPALLWAFVAATLKSGRGDLAERAYQQAADKLEDDHWAEYYDGRAGRLIGRRANFNQVWTATALIVSHQFLEGSELLYLFPR